jgi:hypothetical protein
MDVDESVLDDVIDEYLEVLIGSNSWVSVKEVVNRDNLEKYGITEESDIRSVHDCTVSYLESNKLATMSQGINVEPCFIKNYMTVCFCGRGGIKGQKALAEEQKNIEDDRWRYQKKVNIIIVCIGIATLIVSIFSIF